MAKITASVEEQMSVLMRGVEYGDANIQRTMEEDLRELLSTGRPLRVYCGFDPTFTGLTLGNLVPMLKLRQFQRFGHEVTFLMGTMTAVIGDPSDKTSARQMLTPEAVEANMQDWLAQAFRVLDPEKTIVRRNGDWLAPLALKDVVDIASNFTVAQFLEHETFRKRMDEGKAALHPRVHLRPHAGLRRLHDGDGRAGGRRRPAVQHHGRPHPAAREGQAAARCRVPAAAHRHGRRT